MDGVVAGQGGGIFGVAAPDQQADAGEHAQEVAPGGRFCQVFARCLQEKVDFLIERSGFQHGFAGPSTRWSEHCHTLPISAIYVFRAQRIPQKYQQPAFPDGHKLMNSQLLEDFSHLRKHFS